MHAKSPVTRENILLIFTSPISSDWKNFSAGTVPIGKKCDLRESSCSFRATGACGARSISGGVAERLIALVLKTGRPKGLVSSNLTPSASLVGRSARGACITVSHNKAADFQRDSTLSLGAFSDRGEAKVYNWRRRRVATL